MCISRRRLRNFGGCSTLASLGLIPGNLRPPGVIKRHTAVQANWLARLSLTSSYCLVPPFTVVLHVPCACGLTYTWIIVTFGWLHKLCLRVQYGDITFARTELGHLEACVVTNSNLCLFIMRHSIFSGFWYEFAIFPNPFSHRCHIELHFDYELAYLQL